MNNKYLKFWCYTNMDLISIGNKLVENNIISDFIDDYENVYEWLQCNYNNNSYELNISRKHSENLLMLEKNELVFMLISNEVNKDISRYITDRKLIETLARKISNVLNIEIIVGYGEYLSGDDFKYYVEMNIKPSN